MNRKWVLMLGLVCFFPLLGNSQERQDKPKAEPEFIRDYFRVEARGTLTSTAGIIKVDVRPFVFGGSHVWKLVLQTPEMLKTAKGLEGKKITLKGELQFIDGQIGKDGKLIPPDNHPFNPPKGEFGIVVSELKAADSPKGK
jgi:hypothetical protein